jgi:hypothetical protein
VGEVEIQNLDALVVDVESTKKEGLASTKTKRSTKSEREKSTSKERDREERRVVEEQREGVRMHRYSEGDRKEIAVKEGEEGKSARNGSKEKVKRKKQQSNEFLPSSIRSFLDRYFRHLLSLRDVV